MPKPRSAPAGGRLVYRAYESIATSCTSYGPGAVKPDFCVTRGPMSAYAPPFHHTSHSRAMMRPSFDTPLLMRKVLACLVMVKNCSSIVREIFTGFLANKDKTLTRASSFM